MANLVHVIDTASGKVLNNMKVGKRPRRFALTPDGAQLWVTNELDADVSVLSTKDYSVIATLPFEVKGARAADITPVGITMTKDGKRAFVALGPRQPRGLRRRGRAQGDRSGAGGQTRLERRARQGRGAAVRSATA